MHFYLENIIYHHLHASRLPMLWHTARHRFQQVMKLHRNLKSLSQSRTIYEFLVKGHVIYRILLLVGSLLKIVSLLDGNHLDIVVLSTDILL